MTGDQRRDRIRTEALARLATLGEMAEQVVSQANDAAGERILTRRQPGILDARHTDLAAMETQARHYIEAMALIRQWLLPNDTRTLGAALKVAPAEVAAAITAHLVEAGVLPGEDTR